MVSPILVSLTVLIPAMIYPTSPAEIDFKGSLVGKRLDISLVRYLRKERRFDSIGSLKRQIDLDKEKAIKVLGNANKS